MSNSQGRLTRPFDGIPPASFYASSSSAQSRMCTPPPPERPLQPASTPISKKISGSQQFSSTIQNQDDDNRRRLAQETAGFFLGPMPCKSFLNRFLPLATDVADLPETKGAFRHVSTQTSESAMYAPFIEAAQTFGPDLLFVNTSSHADPQCDGLKPDVSVYSQGTKLGNRVTDFSRMEMWLEFKLDDAHDAFDDPPDPLAPANHEFEKDSELGYLTRGQLASYAAAHMGIQFRIHTFSVLLCGKFARFLRWDRAGVVVSRAFDYTRRPDLLAGFFWRYNHLDPKTRGHDTSVSKPTKSEIQHAKERLQLDKDKFVKLLIPGGPGTGVSDGHYIIPMLRYTSRSPFGRATRPSRAYSVEADKVVFYKDYWRVDEPGMRKEGEIYALLKQHEVPHIAPFDRGDDVLDHATVTQALRSEQWACTTKKMSCYKHYRMGLNVVGRDLTTFTSSWEFVSAIADGMEAHQVAYEKANILHRDISAGNIILTDGQEGLLIDWDLSVDVDALNSPRRPERTGTWQFISANLLLDIRQKHTVQDDRESSLHLLTWMALRYTAHNCGAEDLSSLLRMFDEAVYNRQGTRGGWLKRDSLTSGQIPSLVKFKDRPALDRLVEELVDTFAVRYERAPTAEQIQSLDTVRKIPGVPEDALSGMVAFDHQARMDKLASPTWLVETFRRHLQNRTAWPEVDRAVPQLVESGEHMSSRKRKSDQARMESNVPRLGKMLREDSSSLTFSN